MNRAITNAQAGAATAPKAPGDAAPALTQTGAQAWRREIERAQASAWLSLPVVGAGSEKSNPSFQCAMQQIGTRAKPALAQRDSGDERVPSPRPDAHRAKDNASPLQRHDSQPPSSATLIRSPMGDAQATANVSRGERPSPARSAAAFDDIDRRVSPQPVAAQALQAPSTGPAGHSFTQAQPPKAEECAAPPQAAAARCQQAADSSADDRSPVRLSLALQGHLASVWLGIDEHMRPHLPQIVAAAIKDLNAKGLTVDRLICNGEVVVSPDGTPQRKPHPSHLDRGER
jgi:hypothetical protein